LLSISLSKINFKVFNFFNCPDAFDDACFSLHKSLESNVSKYEPEINGYYLGLQAVEE